MKRAAAILFVSLLSVVVWADMGRPLTALNLRSAPTSRRNNVITVIGASDRLEILETRRGWYRVRIVKTGVEGWVAQKYVTITPPEPEQTPTGIVDSGKDGKGLATGGNVAIMAGLLALVGYMTGYKSTTSALPVTRKDPNRFPTLGLCLMLGTLYVILTLPKVLMNVGMSRGWSLMVDLGAWSVTFNQQIAESLPLFQRSSSAFSG